MANVIRHKRGTSDPAAGDFSETAELLVNTSDGGLFTKTDGGSVVEIGADADTLDGQQASYFLNTSSSSQTKGSNTDSRARSLTLNLTATGTFSANADIGDGNRNLTVQNTSTSTTNGLFTALHMQVGPTSTARVMGDIKFVRDSGLRGKWYFSSKNTSGSFIDTLAFSTDDFTYKGNNVWHAGNDGTGSGLDADTVDGLQATSFLRADADDTFTGSLTGSGNAKITFGPNSTWSKYLVVGGNGYGGNSNTASIATTNGNLHLDAATSNASYLNFYAGTAGVAFGDGSTGIVAWMGPDGDLWKGSSDNSGSKYWHAGNDGSGSGLDADLLDGQQGSYYAPLASPTFTGTPAAPTASAGTNTTQVATTAFVQTAVESVVDSAPGALDTLNELAAALGDDANFSTTVTNSIAEKLPKSGGTMTGDLIVTTGASNGIFWGSSGPNITNVSSGTGDLSIQNIDQLRFGSSGAYDWNGWAGIGFNSSTEVLTIGGPASSAFTSNSNPPDITINFDGLSGTNGLTYEGSTIWHAGNDGSGSGLDADTVDGVEATSFLRSDADDTASGTYIFDDTSTTPKVDFSGIGGSTTYNYIIRGQNDAGSRAVHFINGSGRTDDGGADTYTIRNDGGSLRLGKSNYSTLIEGSGDLTFNANKVWHAGNDGSGTGLDADTVDGVHASSFFQANNALSATTGAFSGDVTMSGTGALKVANGTTAQRPTAATGQIRYNTTLGALESYVSGAWQVIANTALDYGLITSASDTTFDYGALS